MANNTKYTGLTNYANYHTFSKLQVGNNVNFGGSINRSGHTVTNTDAWLDDVPFFNTFTTPSAALAAVGKSTVQNDLISIAVAEGDIATGIYRRNNIDNTDGSKSFNEIFVPYTIGTDKDEKGATVLLNKNGKAVVRVWAGQQLTLLDGDNNSNANSEGQAARIIIDGAPVEQFIAVPDVCRSGYPSNGYSIKVYNDGTPMTMDFGTVTNTFFDVPFAGVIMFGGGTDGSVYTIDCFEYIGDKLAAVNTKIADIQETIENLTVEAGEGIKQIKTAEGSGITVAIEGVEGATKLTPVIDIDTNVIATKASVDAVAEDVSEIQQTIESGVVSSVTASSDAKKAGITVGGTDTEPEIQVTVGEVSDSSEAVVTGKAVAAAIDAAKQAAIDGAKVTLIQGTGITVTPNNTPSNSFTVAVDNTVATTQSVTDLAGRVTTAEGEIDALQETVNGLTSGDNSVDSKIAAAKTEITGTEITKQTVSGAGIDVTLDGTVGAPTLTGSVTTATYTKATENAAGSWSNETQVVTAGAVKSALADVDAKHTADIEKVEAAIESLSTSGFSREIVTELPTTDIKLNAIYLVANKESDANEYVEYIYVGGTVIDGQLTNGRFEQIGTTKTDLSEYAKTADVNASFEATNAEVAKKANSTDVYTKTEIDGKVTTINDAVGAAATKGQQGIDDAATAKTAADDAQANATQALADAATAKSAADAAQAAADAAQGEVDDLEGAVSALSQVVADNKTAAEAAIALKADQSALDTTNATVAGHTTSIETLNDTIIPAITDRLDAIEAIPTVEVVAAEGTTEAPNYVTVSSNTADGKTTFTVASTGALETRLDTLESFIGTGDPDAPNLSEILATKVDNVTGGSNGITITTADTANSRVATLSVTPDTTVTKDSVNVVTSGAVETAISNSAGTTLSSAKGYTEEQIGALKTAAAGTVAADNTAISITQTDAKVTAVTVTKGEIVDKNTNLVDGGTVYAVTSAIETRLSKVETAADTGVDSKITTAIEALDGGGNSAGVEVTQVNGVVTTVTVTPGSVTEGDNSVVTGGAVYTAVEAVKTIAEAKISVVQNDNTHFGSPLVTTSDTTVTVSPAKEWSVGDTKPVTTITSVINGKMSDGSTIDDANLVDGSSMFAGNTVLATYVGDLSKLTNGTSMFSGCAALTTFVGNLDSLTDGTNMFANCKLTEESLIYIVDSLPTFPVETPLAHTITVGVATGVDKAPYVTEATAKGWTLN